MDPEANTSHEYTILQAYAGSVLYTTHGTVDEPCGELAVARALWVVRRTARRLLATASLRRCIPALCTVDRGLVGSGRFRRTGRGV
jgi:hypothetical protein